MGRLSTFVFGGIIGAVLVFGSLKYHLVRAPDGLHLIPKLESNLSETYVDVRQFGPQLTATIDAAALAPGELAWRTGPSA